MSVDVGITELGDIQNTVPQTDITRSDIAGALPPSNTDSGLVRLKEEASIAPQENPQTVGISEVNVVENKGESPADTRHTSTTNKPYLDEIKRRKFDKKAKNKLFVGGLVLDATEDFLYDKFQSYGAILDGRYQKAPNLVPEAGSSLILSLRDLFS